MTTDPQTLPQWKTVIEPPQPNPVQTKDVLDLTPKAALTLHYERYGYSALCVFHSPTPKPDTRLDVLRWMETETAKALDVLRQVIAAEEGTTP